VFPVVYFDEFVLHGLYAVKNTVKIMNYAFEIILLIPVVVHLILLSETTQQILGKVPLRSLLPRIELTTLFTKEGVS
jgi:hypothetical protein